MQASNTYTKVTISQIKNTVRKLLQHDEAKKLSIGLWGPPGIGKTQATEQVGNEIGAKCKVFLTGTMDPTDMVGVPHPILERRITEFFPPERLLCLTEESEYQGPMIALFDDMPACDPKVFAALFRFFQQREVEDRKVRDNVLLCATGNGVEDRAGAEELPTPLVNRFVHFYLKISVDEWVKWAMSNGVVEEVVAFIRSMENMLHDFDPTRGDLAFPTPRSVAMASTLIKAIGFENSFDLKVALEGCCGKAWATNFIEYQKVRDKMVPAAEIIKNPDKVKVPEQTDVGLCFATMTSLIYYLKAHLSSPNIINAVKYSARLPHKQMGITLAQEIIINVVMDKTICSEDIKSEVLTDPTFLKLMPDYVKYCNEI